ncbi:MAG TPA: hypothetical protein VFQ71_11850 [Gaiellales bacterium]|jgi:hypothetical protein|nr:hypothetical protein [Gaiellales bacterium]
MGGRWGRSRARFLACAWLAGALLAWPAAALADSGPASTGVKPNHLGTVITGKEVFISWISPAGVRVAHVYAYRAPTCQGQNGTRVGPTVPATQIIDLSVTPGSSYCYTIYVADQAGKRTEVGSTGPVTVPGPGARQPAVVAAATAPAPATEASSLSASTIAGVVAAVAGALILLYLLVRIVRHGRGAASAPSPAYGSPSRMAAVREQRPALIIPAVIALAWVIVVTAAVVFR